MSNKNRIYGESVPIDTDKVHEFWESRAEKYTDDNPYVSVKCHDKDTEYQKKSEIFEKELLLPKIGIKSNDIVLDIGCGVGRLAMSVAPFCKQYVGVDFSSSLLDCANRHVGHFKNCKFVVSDFVSVTKNSDILSTAPYSIVLIAGITMYLSDSNMRECMEMLLSILSPKCKIYMTDQLAIKERLTLNQFYSQEMNSSYSVIYRTKKEYLDSLKPLFDSGFVIKYGEFILQETDKYKETSNHYFILEK